MPVSKVKVVPMEIGGGFGGKIAVYLEPVAALLEPQDRPAR
jgi:xanthine dehydrogenase molybdenum-binding subunit